MDSDKILVMDGGKIVEFDHPYNLLKKHKDGFLFKMVEQTGQVSVDFLHGMAAQVKRKSLYSHRHFILSPKQLKYIFVLVYLGF